MTETRILTDHRDITGLKPDPFKLRITLLASVFINNSQQQRSAQSSGEHYSTIAAIGRLEIKGYSSMQYCTTQPAQLDCVYANTIM
jgi:hypothetical protein